MKVSVIIPTYNGAKKIIQVLKALENQTFQEFEIQVVIDGSTDDTLSVLEKTNFALKDLKWTYQANGGRSVARNRGVKEANGAICIFLDDDMRPLPDVIKSHLEHHLTHPHTILVGSPLEEIATMKTDFQCYKGYLSRKWLGQLPLQNGIIQSPFITTANFSIPKSLFTQLNGFDEQLTDAEDFDLAVKAFDASIPIYFKQEIVAWHDDFITCRSYIRRLKQYKKAHQKLLNLYPERYVRYFAASENPISTFKKIIYSLFAQRFWIWSIDRFNWLKIFPRKIRYKLYDIITTAFAFHFPEREV